VVVHDVHQDGCPWYLSRYQSDELKAEFPIHILSGLGLVAHTLADVHSHYHCDTLRLHKTALNRNVESFLIEGLAGKRISYQEDLE
jgi:hypothetical protein